MGSLIKKIIRRAGLVIRSLVISLMNWGPEHWCCISRAGGRTIRLRSHFLGEADYVELEMAKPWARLWRWLQPVLCVTLLDAYRCGLPHLARATQRSDHGLLLLSVTLPCAPDLLGPQVTVQLRDADNAVLLSEITFTRLDRKQVLEAIQVESFDVQVSMANGAIVTNRLHERVEDASIRVQLALRDGGLRHVCQEIPPQVYLVFVASDRRVVGSVEAMLQFSAASAQWGHEFRECLPALKTNRGRYEVHLLVEERLLQSIPLEVRSWDEALSEAAGVVASDTRVIGSQAIAVNHHSQPVTLDVVAEDFQSISAELTLEVPGPDPLIPEVTLPLVVQARTEAGVFLASLRESHFVLRPGHSQVRTHLPIHQGMFRKASGTCRLEVLLAERVLASFPFIQRSRAEIRAATVRSIIDRLTITDFEVAVQRDGKITATEPIFATDDGLLPRFSIRGDGFDDDVTEVVCPLELVLSHSVSGESLRASCRLRLRAGLHRCTRLRLPLSKRPCGLRGGMYRLRLLEDGRELAGADLRILAADEILAYMRDMVHANLRVTAQEMFYECGGGRLAGTEVPFCADRVILRVRLESHGFNSSLSEWEAPLELQISGQMLPTRAVAVGTVSLNQQGVWIDVPMLVRGTPLQSYAGDFELGLRIHDKPVSSVRCRLISADLLAEAVEVTGLLVSATDRQGRSLREVTSLSLQEHVEFGISVALRCSASVPGYSMPVRIELLARQKIMLSAERALPLEASSATWPLQPVRVAALWGKVGGSAQHVTIRVQVGGHLRASRDVALEAETRITAFDGALRQNPQALGDVTDEYEDILRTLDR